MKEPSNSDNLLQQTLHAITQEGIQVDPQQLKKDMVAQFADPYEFIREYVVNAYDADATWCMVRVRETEKDLIVQIQDDGCGMDREILLQFFQLYRSVQNGQRKKTGKFGVGKLSVAAIPGQNGFEILTSTGQECWQVKTGSLLADDPIDLQRLDTIPGKGTTFIITFEKKDPIQTVVERLQNILQRYVLYLDIEIIFDLDEDLFDQFPPTLSRYTWAPSRKHPHLRWQKDGFDLIIEPGTGQHRIYQNRVFITDRYNLLTHDLDRNFKIGQLDIRVDSDRFRLPFGRHCLSDESILHSLVETIRTELLPQFFSCLEHTHKSGNRKKKSYIYGNQLRTLAMDLIKHLPDLDQPWSRFPLFELHGNQRLSLVELEELVAHTGKLYLAASDQSGIDYDLFDGPVITDTQAQHLAFLQSYFQKELINLSTKDLVMVAPSNLGKEPSEEERAFAGSLGFRPFSGRLKQEDWMDAWDMKALLANSQVNNSKNANRLYELNWEVRYLVGRDGKTPCTTHLFLAQGDEVILNLHHSDIKKLVFLHATTPNLAGFYASALCLTENKSILPFFSERTREELVLLEAMNRLQTGPFESEDDAWLGEFKDKLWDQLRDDLSSLN